MEYNDVEIIDVHVHLLRNSAQQRAVLGPAHRRDCNCWGNPESVTGFMNRNKISHMVILNLFPANQMVEKEVANLSNEFSDHVYKEKRHRIQENIRDKIRRSNDWICSVGLKHPRLLPFINTPPLLGSEDMANEVSRCVNQGAKGLKMHPGFYKSSPDDKLWWPTYEVCQSMKIPILADSTWIEGEKPGEEFGRPSNFLSMLSSFPNLTLIMAHLGSAYWDERVEISKQYDNVFFDTSQGFAAPDRITMNSIRRLAEQDAVRIIRKIGVERIMFGSDGPYLDWLPQLEQILRCNLTEKEKRMILSENAKRILNIPGAGSIPP
jgi:predicted TIM-barrel fold metal-dependent hydrolase